jgi:glycosyltransferase involved in cell wall biosynthesis
MNNAVIIIPFHFTWNWATDYYKKTAFELSKKNDVICYLGIEPVRFRDIIQLKNYSIFSQYSPRLWVYRPIQIIPLERLFVVQWINVLINAIIIQILELLYFHAFFKRKRILWVCNQLYSFFPVFFMLRHFVLYDCVDYIQARTNEEYLREKTKENHLIAKANMMTVNSRTLYSLHHKIRTDVFVVPQGFRLDEFQNNRNKKSSLKFPKKPIIGMIGTIDDRINFALLLTLVTRHPEWQFVIWGAVVTPNLSKIQYKQYCVLTQLSNVTTGKSSSSDVMDIIRTFDVAIIPYDVTQNFCKYCYPMKLFEYFYMGKPVVSTPIEELKHFPEIVKIGKTALDWEKLIESLIHTSWSKQYIEKQKKMALENSWEKKIEMISINIDKHFHNT